MESVWRGREPGEPREGRRRPWGGLRKALGNHRRFLEENKMGIGGPVEEPGGEAGKQGVDCGILGSSGDYSPSYGTSIGEPKAQEIVFE